MATRRPGTAPLSTRCANWSPWCRCAGVVVIGEGEKDEAPMLYNGEEVGNGLGPDCDFAVDPVDGTTLMAKGMPNAISVLAVAERGAMFDPSAVFYMEKIAVGPDAADAIDITAPVSENLRKVAKAKKSSVSDLTVCILDRPRHAELNARVVQHRLLGLCDLHTSIRARFELPCRRYPVSRKNRKAGPPRVKSY